MEGEETNNHKNCFVCKKRIINPMCMNCRMKQLESWLSDQRLIAQIQTEIIDQAKNIFPKENGTLHSCMLCKKNVMICMPCFFSPLNDELQKMDIPPETKESFPKTFNYQLYLKDIIE